MAKRVLIKLITLYQRYLSPFTGPSCRFYPSCSQYAIETLGKHGLFRGSWRAAYRIIRCNPFHPGGYDPVR